MKLTIFFDGSFWCGLVEVQCAKQVQVWKHVFGPEPKDAEVLAFVNKRLLAEWASVPCVSAITEQKQQYHINPKRQQRLAHKLRKKPVLSTKAQAAMQAEREIKRVDRRHTTKANRLAEQQARFQQRQAKKLQKHKGH
ncbi:YjdF family protein [Agrilactobacillus fermenti]|uniref:YjdF family protein n=1 Tax=Agrilactobacillus fermenti TaxID=2586909 RepID=UPI003A5BD470